MNSEKIIPATALVLCAGNGTRLHELTGDRLPKHLFPVAGVPIVERSVQPLLDANVAETYLILYHKAQMIIDHFAHDSRINTFVIPEVVGFAASIETAVSQNHCQNSIILLEGDTIRHGVDIKVAWEQHITNQAHTTLVVTSKPTDRDNAFRGVITDEDNRITRFREPKEATPNLNPLIGLGIFSQAAVGEITSIPDKSGGWSKFLPYLFNLGKMYASIQPIQYFNINTPESVKTAEDFFASNCNN